MKLKLIIMLMLLSPLTASAGDTNTEASKLSASQVSSKQGSENGVPSTVVGRIAFVKRRSPVARLNVNASPGQEYVMLWLRGGNSDVHGCRGKYHLETIYDSNSQLRARQKELKELGGTWVELSAVKTFNFNQGTTCSFGRLKSVPEPK